MPTIVRNVVPATLTLVVVICAALYVSHIVEKAFSNVNHDRLNPAQSYGY